MFRFVRTLAFATAGIGAVAGPAILTVAACRPASAQTAQAAEPEKSRTSAKAKSARRSAKGKAAGGEEKAATVDAEATLDKARRALADGKAESAHDLADSVVKNAKKDPRNTARALAVRGEALVRLGRPAEAYADLQSALWVKGGLAGAEREAAVSARAQAGEQAGLGGAQRGTERAHVQAERRAASASSAAPEQPSLGFGGFFSSLFGGGGGSQTQPDTSRTPATTAATAPKRPAVSSSEPQRIEPPARKSDKAHAPPPARAATAVATEVPAGARGGGIYRIQLAAVRSRREAEDMARSVRKAQAGVLGARNYEIIEEIYGNMGRFYRVRIGAFDHPTEAMAICATLRQSKVDCMMIDK